MRTTPYKFIETILRAKAENGKMGEVFDRSINRWSQSTTLMDAFARRALNSPRFTGPVTNFVESHMDKNAEEWRLPTKAEALPLPDLSELWPQPLPLPPSSDEDDRRKHWGSRCTTQELKSIYLEKRQTNQDWYSSTRFDRDTNSLSSEHQ